MKTIYRVRSIRIGFKSRIQVDISTTRIYSKEARRFVVANDSVGNNIEWSSGISILSLSCVHHTSYFQIFADVGSVRQALELRCLLILTN